LRIKVPPGQSSVHSGICAIKLLILGWTNLDFHCRCDRRVNDSNIFWQQLGAVSDIFSAWLRSLKNARTSHLIRVPNNVKNDQFGIREPELDEQD
jgi:hypothetical protein